MDSATSILFVVSLGISTVFIGLICIIILTKIMSAFCNNTKQEIKSNIPDTPASSDVNNIIENRQEIIAAVSAAVAEELGTDVSAIRILSFKKI